ncbi:Myb/SANT-like DNA-binding domain protein [Metarhizium robertsii]|uniref:Myb/SANT-like DNA-binding domain protein n=1 Tax=Metarhizium robertsii TaxID=568076 RepID=A0A0A1V2W7_9HYPO|nr:Myb/SANT-like DNA-binding domain protein [Metarhizium robertsii]
MSEDDVDMLGPDGQGSSKVDRDRRAPRFSWTPAYETTFFRSLCESVQLGLRENSSFKAEAWDRAALALQDSHGAYPAKSHLINKSDNARKRFRLWRGLREDPEFMYNPVSKTVTATEEAWRAHIEREPLSRALRGRPFDHEEYMEILYPDVIGSGGAPKRIMKPRRRTDGQPGDESDMPGTGVLNLQPESASGQNTLESPGPARSSLSQTPIGSATASGTQLKPSSTTIPPRTTPTQPSALTPPDESANHAKKRVMPAPQTEGAFGATPPPSAAKSGNATADAPSPEKKRRTSIHGDAVPVVTSTSSNCLHHESSSDSPTAVQLPPPVTLATPQTTAADSQPNGLPTCLSSSRWCELALEQFFKDFAGEDMDLQIRVAETVLVNESRALVYCKMPWCVKQHWIKKLDETFRKVR